MPPCRDEATLLSQILNASSGLDIHSPFGVRPSVDFEISRPTHCFCKWSSSRDVSRCQPASKRDVAALPSACCMSAFQSVRPSRIAEHLKMSCLEGKISMVILHLSIFFMTRHANFPRCRQLFLSAQNIHVLSGDIACTCTKDRLLNRGNSSPLFMTL